MEERKDILWRVYIVYSFIAIFAIGILFRVFFLQNVQKDYWQSRQETLTTRTKQIEAIRGNIYASDGSLLHTSVPRYEIRIDTKVPSLTNEIFKENLDSLAFCLADLFKDKEAYEYKRTLRDARELGSRYHLIKRKVSYLELKKLKTFPILRNGKNKGGLIVIQKNKRVRPFKVLAARTIGYAREGLRPVGLEGAYNEDLKGVDGLMLVQRISGGHEKQIADDSQIEPKDGYDLVSTIDINMQDVAETTLLKQLIQHQADHGSVILMEVKTGKIRAIANMGRDAEGDYYERYNYAVGESTEPGSTFKLASLIAALEDGYVKITDTVDTENGRVMFYDRTMRDSHKGGYGKITVKRAFEVSSNVAFSKIINSGYSKNPQRFVDKLHDMGLNKSTKCVIAGESTPQIKNTQDKTWSGVTLPWMSIGYEVSLTPLQTLTFYNAIANNGKMMKPIFAERVMENGELVRKIEPEVLSYSICSKSTISKVKECLEGVVKNGTARNLSSASFQIAGKTGTTQLGYSDRTKAIEYQASFAGYFPADDPQYSCIVVINKPVNGYYGNTVAGPIFKEIANKVYASRIDLHKGTSITKARNTPFIKNGNQKDIQTVLAGLNVKTEQQNADTKWVVTQSGDDKVELQVRLIERDINKGLIPDVRGMGIKDAMYLLENAGLNVKIVGYGIIVKQSLARGDKILPGREIILELA